MSKVAVLLADGFEEIEATTVVDVLRRADVEVDAMGVEDTEVTGAHSLQYRADVLLGEQSDLYDMLVLPGGLPGAHTLRDHPGVQALVQQHQQAGKWLAAICAAPIALGKAGLLEGKKATCYPGFEGELSGANAVEDRVVQDGNIVTSRGPGTALEFSLKLVELLQGKEMADALRESMLVI